MVDNINTQDYADINPNVSATRQKTLSRSQMSLLNRSMLYAGIGFVLIALIGFAIAMGIWKSNNIETLNNSITLLWTFSIILILVSMILSMVVNVKLFTRMGNVSKGLIYSMWTVYIVAEGLGFGLLFLAFMVQFNGQQGILYLIFVFAAGGIAFMIAALIGKSLSTKAMMSLGKFISILSIAFMVMFFVFMIATIVASFTSSFGSEGLFLMIIGLSTILFLLYMVFDISVISKTQQFLTIDNTQLSWTLAMIFGFRLLVDLVGLIWNIAIFVLRFAR